MAREFQSYTFKLCVAPVEVYGSRGSCRRYRHLPERHQGWTAVNEDSSGQDPHIRKNRFLNLDGLPLFPSLKEVLINFPSFSEGFLVFTFTFFG